MSFMPADPVTDLTLPNAAEATLARDSARHLAATLAEAKGPVRLRVDVEGTESVDVTVPASALRLLVGALAQMATGNAVRLIPHHAELTTQEAAEILNVSRPYLVRLLDEGRIPFQRVGTHRRVLFKDVMTYKAEHRVARRAALKELARLDQELGLT